MIKQEIKNRYSGEGLFVAEINAETDTPLCIRLGFAVKKAIEQGADLSGADLSGANLSSDNLSIAKLRCADLSNADLSGADLRYADLSNADLNNADLSCADLRCADLSSAKLSNADLSGADLSGAKLTCADIVVLQTNIWTAYIQNTHIRIGCKYHSLDEWAAFDDLVIDRMDSQALDWWRQWKPAIIAVHKARFGEKGA